MSTLPADLSIFKDKPSKRVQQEMVTPYKLCVAVLIRSYCQYKEWDEKLHIDDVQKVSYRKDFCILALKVLQGPDLKLSELKQLFLSNSKITSVFRRFDETLSTMYKDGIGALLDIVDSLKQIMTPNDLSQNETRNESKIVNQVVVTKNSVIGYFLRRFIIYFEKLTFSEVSGVYEAFLKYYNECRPSMSMASGCESKHEEWSSYRYLGEKQWSRRQAELFLATQAALLQNDEEKALSPPELQNRISSILKSNPDLAEAHFMSFLNYLRAEEFCGAMQSLFHCFDRRTNPDVKGFNDEKSKEHRYAALNLAILHYHFGYIKEALASLREAIKIAHEANDNVCLQHALAWLYRLSNINKDNLIVQCIIKTFELNLNYTTSLALQNFAQFASAKVSLKPSVIFETLTKSDMLNCQNNYKDLISNNTVMKASLWQLYGKTEMCSLWSQSLLHLNIDTNSNARHYHYGEGYLLAVCNTALVMLLQGEYNLVNAILSFARQKFPHEPHSRTWMLVENLTAYTRALFHENWTEAESAAQKLMVLDNWEGCLKLAELHLYMQEYEESEKYLDLIIKNYDPDEHLNDGKFCLLRAKIMLAQVQFASSYPNNTGTMLSLCNCLVEAEKPELAYQMALVYLHIANVLLSMKLVTQALEVLRHPKCMVEILANGGNFDKARATLLYVKCLISDSAKLDPVKRKREIFLAAESLNEVKRNFEKVEAFSRLQDVLYLQAQLYNSLNMTSERNQCALDYRLLKEEHHSKNVQTLIKFL